VSYWSSLGEFERNFVFPTHIFPLCVRDGTHVRAWDASGRCPSCDLPREALIFPTNVQWLFQYGQADIPALHIYLGNGPTLHDDTMLMSVCVDERPRTEGQKGHHRAARLEAKRAGVAGGRLVQRQGKALL
jgi:hypothetical protein